MLMQFQRSWAKRQILTLGIVLGLAFTSIAWGQSDAERKALIAKVNPSVVQVRQEHSLGSGFVVSVDKGSAIIATNYHVVEGAKQLTVFFPTDKDKRVYPADGYIAILPGKDLALLHVNLGNKNIKALKLAEKVPEQGDTVYTFGSPLGQDNTIAPGMVSSVRSGQEVAFTKTYSYDLDVTWIQHTAPISHGNSGGPLVNAAGEVVGLNTISSPAGQALNYSVSAKHLKQLITTTGTNVLAFASLPPPRNFHQSKPSGSGRPGVHITLPSGAELTEAMLEVPRKQQLMKLFPDNALVHVAKYPNDSLQGLFTLNDKQARGKLDGAGATFHESGHFHTLAFYSKGNLHGSLKVWDEEGNRVLYAEYKNGKKNGLVCLFQDGEPCLIEEWTWQDQKNPKNKYLAKGTQGGSLLLSKDEDGEMSKAIQQLVDLETTMQQNDRKLKKELLEWFHNEDKREKQRRVAEQAPTKMPLYVRESTPTVLKRTRR